MLPAMPAPASSSRQSSGAGRARLGLRVDVAEFRPWGQRTAEEDEDRRLGGVVDDAVPDADRDVHGGFGGQPTLLTVEPHDDLAALAVEELLRVRVPVLGHDLSRLEGERAEEARGGPHAGGGEQHADVTAPPAVRRGVGPGHGRPAAHRRRGVLDRRHVSPRVATGPASAGSGCSGGNGACGPEAICTGRSGCTWRISGPRTGAVPTSTTEVAPASTSAREVCSHCTGDVRCSRRHRASRSGSRDGSASTLGTTGTAGTDQSRSARAAPRCSATGRIRGPWQGARPGSRTMSSPAARTASRARLSSSVPPESTTCAGPSTQATVSGPPLPVSARAEPTSADAPGPTTAAMPAQDGWGDRDRSSLRQWTSSTTWSSRSAPAATRAAYSPTPCPATTSGLRPREVRLR